MKIELKRAATILLLIVSLLEINCASGGKSQTVSQNENANTASPINADRANASQTNANQFVAPQEIAAPLIELSAPKEARANTPLEIHWKISNPTREPVFVYSALLEKNAAQFVEVEKNNARKIVEIRFTRLAKIALEPNFFPKAAFLKIEPGKSTEGDFSLTEIPAGEWSATASIGYGGEIESVRKQAADAKGEHPINPVVAWQKLASSEPLKIGVR